MLCGCYLAVIPLPWRHLGVISTFVLALFLLFGRSSADTPTMWAVFGRYVDVILVIRSVLGVIWLPFGCYPYCLTIFWMLLGRSFSAISFTRLSFGCDS